MSLSPLWTEIDWDRDGRQDSYLNLEHSVHRSAYGVVQIPVTVFQNGRGPTLLLMAGVHGDEYEGQAILTRLVRTLQLDSVSGRVIVLSAANLPAAMAGSRVSPLDGGNLNRCFGDAPSDDPTPRIAQYIAEHLFPISDVVFDIHSGGSSLVYTPCAYADLWGDPKNDALALAALEAMNAPISWIQRGVPQGPVAGRAAYRQGAIYLSGEFGGGGALSRHATWVAERALYRLMAHLRMLPLADEWQDTIESRLMQAGQRHYFYAARDGLFEPCRSLGDEVAEGELAGTILTPEVPTEPGLEVRFPASGTWVCARAIGRVQRGDCLGHLLAELSRDEILRAE